MTKEIYDSFASDSEALQNMLTMGDTDMNKLQTAISVFIKDKGAYKEQRMFTFFVKGNETYNDVIKEAERLAEINGFDDYYITAGSGYVDIWEKRK